MMDCEKGKTYIFVDPQIGIFRTYVDNISTILYVYHPSLWVSTICYDDHGLTMNNGPNKKVKILCYDSMT